MSRCFGKREREILAGLTDTPIPVGGATRTERVANRRAARSLERRGLADVFVLWNETRTGGAVCVVRVGAVNEDGQTWKSLSVACAPEGAQATHKGRPRLLGSLRSIAKNEGVSVTAVRRDLASLKERS